MLNQGISNGWSAWYDYWSAKSYSLRRLREVANHLHAPALSTAFFAWARDTEHTRQRLERERLEMESRSVEVTPRRPAGSDRTACSHGGGSATGLSCDVEANEPSIHTPMLSPHAPTQ